MRKHYSYTENEMGEKPTDKKVSICIIQRIKNYLSKLIETNNGWQMNGVVYSNKEILQKFKNK